MPSPLSAPSASIDIMMPFYGSFELFQDAVLSVQAQLDPRWHLTIIDDRYPDPAPAEWARGLNDPRITVLENSENLGVSGNFARSVELATAEFTVIMGCDDVLLPNYVGRMHELVQLFPDAAYVQPGVEVIDAEGTISLPLADRVKGYYRPAVSTATRLSGEKLATSLLRGNWTYFPSILWRTELLKKHGFRADLDVVLDLALQIEIVADGGTLLLDTVPSFQYRRHQASVSSWKASDGSRFDEERNYFLETAAFMRGLGWKSASGAASRHISSRLNAITQIPSAIKASDQNGTRSLLKHAFGRQKHAVKPAGSVAPDSIDKIIPMPDRLKRTLIVMPAFNEEEVVGDVVREVLQTLPGVHCLVVNDGSRDNTSARAREAGATVAELPFNLGVGGAMRLGFRYAIEHGFDNVVQLDSDGQHDPRSVPALLAKLDDADLVIGARFAGEGEYEVRGPRKWAMLFLASTLSRTAQTTLTDTTSGFKAMGPRTLTLFAQHYPAEYLGDTIEALVIASRAGCKIVQVPVSMRPRAGGKPSHNPFKAAAYLGRAFLALGFALMRPASPLPDEAAHA